jgi:hypothetical protein
MKCTLDYDITKRFQIFFLLLSIGKLILISNYELGSGGFDASEYARLSLAGYWEDIQSINIWDLRRGPGVPILTLLFRLTGIPYVLGLEFLNLLFFYALCVFSFKYFPFPLVVTGAVFAILSPASYSEQLLMSDQPYAIFLGLQLLMMAISIRNAIEKRPQSVWATILIGVFSFFTITMRDEGAFIYFIVLAYCLILFFIYKKSDLIIAGKQTLLIIVVVIIPILITISLNYYYYGFFGVSIRGETKDLYIALHKISLAKTPHIVGISEEAIQIAANASSSFKKTIAPRLISYRNKWGSRRSWRAIEINNILRALNESKFTPKQGLRHLEKCTNEIRENVQGIDTYHLYIYPFGNSIFNIGTWITRFPVRFAHVFSLSYNGFKKRFREKKNRAGMFNLILNRRTGLIHNDVFEILDAIRTLITKHFSIATVLVVAVAFIISSVCVLSGRTEISLVRYGPFLFIVFALFLRIAAYAVLDSFFFPQESRHIVNVNPLLVYMTIVMPYFIVSALFMTKLRNLALVRK